MEDQMRTKISYAEIAETLKKTLDLRGSPVAVKLAKSPEGIPEGVKPIEETVRHCQMISRARLNGEIFYATADRHVCMGGGWSLGLKELTQSLRTGEFYYKLGKFESWAACMRTIRQVPHVPTLETYATVYAPLEKTPFDPHVVVIVAKPRDMLKLAQATLYQLGGRIESTMSGIQSVCADATAQPYLTGRINYSLGCDGSRRFSGIEDDELVMGIPAEILPEFARALTTVAGAPGSVR
ncbi:MULTISPECIES: DUF169 domain-containing protein [unclassified Methanoculleus]|jgi:uncharacterized protein (DUF169 family)|uniref:DUF169 domain-containing protein n=1 Tax=unclassified Methanoculleus TaxID=2619537 RepID=UPI0025DCA0D3|nr:DUF169 domain-containing protein [Methanoculleus sp. UBA377]MDD2473778.1 DUF169 domain-containing protein [Methanoculleus sp.]